MSERFTFDSTYIRKFGMLSLYGAILVGLGLWLSTLSFGGAAHGDGHANAGTEFLAQAEHGADSANHASVSSDSSGGVHSDQPASGSHGHENAEAHANAHGTHTHDAPHVAKTGAEAHYNRFVTPDPSGHHHDPFDGGEISMMKKIGTTLLVAVWYFLVIGIFGVFFIAVSHLANASWYVSVKRVFEALYRWIPIGIILLLIVFFAFGKELYSWLTPDSLHGPAVDIVKGKLSFLNSTTLIVLAVIVGGFYTLVGHRFRSSSLREDSEGGTKILIGNRRMSAVFLPIFAFSFCALAFFVLMSIEPTWFSTIYGVYVFANMFVLSMTVVMLITIHMKEKGLMTHVTGEHIHDLGKFMFAFTIFWAYIWVSQYLLIFYANMAEETQYYRLRLDHYKFLFFLNLIVNFFFPFLALMTRNAKRQFASVKMIGGIMLVGRFLDIFLLVAPGVLLSGWNFGVLLASFGMVMLLGGIFLMVIFSGLSGIPLLPEKHPWKEETLHHDVGI